MKIQIDSKEISVTATGISDKISQKEVMDISGKIYDTIKMIHCFENKSENKAVPVETTPKISVPTITSTDSPLIRPRIPNNVVDVKDLTIEKAITENALVRCPHCGQAHVLAVNSGNHIYVMRRFYAHASTDEFRIVAEFDSLNSKDFINMCCKPETDRKAYFEDVQNIKMIDDKDFAANNDTEIFCPVCCKSSTFESWKDAYEHPLAYFETEHLCDACGGEKLEKLIKKTKVYQCDKCGLQTDYKE